MAVEEIPLAGHHMYAISGMKCGYKLQLPFGSIPFHILFFYTFFFVAAAGAGAAAIFAAKWHYEMLKALSQKLSKYQSR